LIDINAPDEAALLEIPTLINLAMLADRKGDPKRVLRRLRKVLELSGRLTQDEQSQLSAWVFDVILRKAKGKPDKDTVESIGKAFERKEETQMTYAIERAIDELEQRGIRKGERKGKLEGIREGKLAGIREGKLEGIREGKLEGIREGERKGKLAGIREGKLAAAMAMLGDGLPLETASKYSGIPADDLRLYMDESKKQ
jgi:flagellar biosynthesis/type III secretory pathway protein FliH